MHQQQSLSTLSGARRKLSVWVGLVAVLGLSACSSLSGSASAVESVVTPYKIDIVQGNVVTKEQAQALRPGMAREQVRDILGSPLLASVFHADRWDYVFTFRRHGQETQRRRLTVFFKDGVLDRFEADELPTESEFVASLDQTHKVGKVPTLQATEAQLKAFAESNATKSGAASAEASPQTPPDTAYPPLEAAGAVQ